MARKQTRIQMITGRFASPGPRAMEYSALNNRLRKVKITLPTLSCLQGEPEDEQHPEKQTGVGRLQGR